MERWVHRFSRCFFWFVALFAFSAAFTGINATSAYAEEADHSGVYEIISASSGMAIDVAGAKMSNGSNIQQYNQNGTYAQLWRIEKSGDHYAIKNSLTGMALDVAGGNPASGTNVQLYKPNGSKAQQWDLIQNDNGETYTILSALGNNALDVKGGSKNKGANIWSYKSNSTKAQQWKLVKVDKTLDDGVYVIGSGLSQSKVLDVSGGSSSNGAKVQLWDSNQSLAQKWAVSYSSSTGLYTVRCALSGKSLDIPGGNGSFGVGIQQYDVNGSSAQLWRIIKNSDGTYTVRSVCSGGALDVNAGSTANGAKIQTWSSNGSAAQKWRFNTTSLALSGLYSIKSVKSNDAVLDVKSASLDQNAPIQVWRPNGTLPQKWQLTELDDGAYTIKSANSGRYLADDNGTLISVTDVVDSAKWKAGVGVSGGFEFRNASTGRALDLAHGNTTAGTSVRTWSYNGQAGQSWKLVSADLVPEGCYTIANRGNVGIVLDVQSGSLSNSAIIQAYNSNKTDAQKWFVQKAGNGWYKLLNVGSNKALNVRNGNPSLGVIQQYAFDGTNACLWKFVVGPSGGVQIVSKLGDYALALKNDLPNSGITATLAGTASATTNSWSFTEATYIKETGSIWKDPAYIDKMRQKAAKWGRITHRPTDWGYVDGKDTGWACTVDIDKARVCVFRKSGSKWMLVKSYNVYVGKYNNKRGSKCNSFSGVWSIKHKAVDLYDEKASGVSCAPWWSCFLECWTTDRQSVGNLVNRYYPGKGYELGQGFHTVSYADPDGVSVAARHKTMGCTGMRERDAKWIYDNVPIDTPVIVFASYDGGKY